MKKLALIPAFLILGACSGSGGGGSSSSSGTGVLSLPKATCGGSVCMASVGSPLRPHAVSSAETLLYMADEIYSYIQETYIPDVNRKISDVENLFASQGYTKCGGVAADVATGEPMIDAISDGTYALDTEYTAVVTSSGLRTSPFATAVEKKFVLRKGLNGFLEVQVGCSSETERVIYLRFVDPTTSNAYQAWGHDSASGKTIIAGSDIGSYKNSLFFNSTSSSVFQVAAVSNGVSFDNTNYQTLAISGGASLNSGSGKLDLHYLANTDDFEASTGGTYNATDAGSLASTVRHCYSNLETAALTAGTNCAGHFTQIPTSDFRGDSARAMSTWNLEMTSGHVLNDAISTTF